VVLVKLWLSDVPSDVVRDCDGLRVAFFKWTRLSVLLRPNEKVLVLELLRPAEFERVLDRV